MATPTKKRDDDYDPELEDEDGEDVVDEVDMDELPEDEDASPGDRRRDPLRRP